MKKSQLEKNIEDAVIMQIKLDCASLKMTLAKKELNFLRTAIDQMNRAYFLNNLDTFAKMRMAKNRK